MSVTVNNNKSALQKARLAYQPKLPKALKSGNIKIEFGKPTTSVDSQEQIEKLFPSTYGQPLATIIAGDGNLVSEPMNVGVVLSGGQAPGGHNVIAGLFDALKAANPASKLYGFLGGPIGVIKGKYMEITKEVVDEYRNTGGFDMIQSGRDKIEKPEDLQACKKTLGDLDCKALVIAGGDDSNTNAAVLAEYLKSEGTSFQVIGVPKTIDGDMKNEYIETSFGFDTASKTFAELIGNIERDAMSATKYWHFIRLMGRSASHVTLETALQCHPNIAIMSEEVARKELKLGDIVDQIVDVVIKRGEAGKNYGVALIPEGLIEFFPDVKVLISELSAILGTDEAYLNSLPDHSERVQFLNTKLSDHSARVYGFLPEDIQRVLLTRDKHGNVPVSQIETERLLIDLVSDKIRLLKSQGKAEKVKFAPLNHFFGYEGRCAFPSNFDADYCYTLGYAAAQLIRGGLTGYTATAQNTTKAADEWVAGGVPVTMMLTIEVRKGQPKPVIKKALVELNDKPFQKFASVRDKWAIEDNYAFPGPIQYFGPAEVADRTTITLELERG